ncbi:MAG: hypothetical protein GEU91_20935 [Rhizobiales bacterium]|nr:hypothetical protein [Hyphomicrobiales bacterium]
MSKPVPVPTTDTAHYWQACDGEELLYQRCGDCGHVQFYPRRSCVSCHGANMTWLPSARRGVIHSFTIVHRPPTPSFDDDAPYVVALIDLDEGYRMMMNVVGDDRASSAIGRRVRVVFEERAPGRKVPQAMLEAAP